MLPDEDCIDVKFKSCPRSAFGQDCKLSEDDNETYLDLVCNLQSANHLSVSKMLSSRIKNGNESALN